MNPNPCELYREAVDAGLRLEVRGGKLIVSPMAKLTPDWRARLTANKPALIQWLNSPPCPGWQCVPPADLPLDLVMPQPGPRRRELVLRFILRQGCDRPAPLTDWLVRRESAYFDGPGRAWDCSVFSYAAARDCACWQLSMSETDVWSHLETPNP